MHFSPDLGLIHYVTIHLVARSVCWSMSVFFCCYNHKFPKKISVSTKGCSTLSMGNESVPKNIIYNTINLFFKLQSASR